MKVNEMLKIIVLENGVQIKVADKVVIVDTNGETFELKIKKLTKKILIGNIQGETTNDRIFRFEDVEDIEIL